MSNIGVICNGESLRKKGEIVPSFPGGIEETYEILFRDRRSVVR
jgi:hypothetical protein